MEPFAVAGLYAFCRIPAPELLRDRLWSACRARQLRGTLILAGEGLNGTIAGSSTAVASQLDELRELLDTEDLRIQHSRASAWPFLRLKVVVKPEIVTLRVPEARPAERVGTYLDSREWNQLLEEAAVPVIDCRNDFEVRVGSFAGAVDPGTKSFVEFPTYVAEQLDPVSQPRVAMFCTGGIRCEKASALLLARGFREVYHLRGGVLRYLEEIPEAESRWRGECFVFDRRVSLGHGLRPGTHVECHGCKMPVSARGQQSPTFEAGVSCPACFSRLDPSRREALRERRRQVELAMARGVPHIGDPLRQAETD